MPTLFVNTLLNRPDPRHTVADGWTAEDFAAATLALAEQLQRGGVRSAALWFDDAARFASALLAAWQAEADVYLPPNLAEENRAWADRAADVWLTDTEVCLRRSRCYSDGQERTRPLSGSLKADILPERRVYMKTSGSSGEAKVLSKTAAQMMAEAEAIARFLPQWRGLAVYASVSQQHHYGLSWRVFAALAGGWTIGRRQCLYPETLAAAAKQPCIWVTSPALLNRMDTFWRNGGSWQQHLRGIVSAGGMLPEQTAAAARHLGFTVHDFYGSTETGVLMYRQGGGLWTPLPEVRLGADGAGELWAEAPWTDGRQQTADQVEFEGGRLRLLGRTDRIIKLEDKRVSLPQIEHRLLAHEWMADAHCALHPAHNRIAVWAALNEAGLEAFRNQGRAAVQQVLKNLLAQSQDAAALPRYWRFAAHVLPRNAQSKISRRDFQAAFTALPTAPEWQTVHEDAAAQEYVFRGTVPPDLVYFGGHFAEFPLVPGVVEIQWAHELAVRVGFGGGTTGMENLKFMQFVRPGDDITVRLRRDAAKGKIYFSVQQGEAVCASGRIVSTAA